MTVVIAILGFRNISCRHYRPAGIIDIPLSNAHIPAWDGVGSARSTVYDCQLMRSVTQHDVRRCVGTDRIILQNTDKETKQRYKMLIGLRVEH